MKTIRREVTTPPQHRLLSESQSGCGVLTDFPTHRRSFVCSWLEREKRMQDDWGGLPAEGHLVTDITVSFCTAIHPHCLALRWDGALQIDGK